MQWIERGRVLLPAPPPSPHRPIPPLVGMLVLRSVTPTSFPVRIPKQFADRHYTAGWRETKWNEVSCLRKQHVSVTMHRPSLEPPTL